MQAKQTETGWDIDARLLLYADAIKRTELLAGLKSSMPPAKATAASEGPATSSPCVADDLNCQDGLPKGLHVKTRCCIFILCPDAHIGHLSSFAGMCSLLWILMYICQTALMVADHLLKGSLY